MQLAMCQRLTVHSKSEEKTGHQRRRGRDLSLGKILEDRSISIQPAWPDSLTFFEYFNAGQ
jgi:hypothetical protein